MSKSKKIKVLYIEDDSDIVDLLSLHLADLGFRTDSASTGSEGLRQALNGEYSLIVLDLMLPEIDGLEICRRLRGAKDSYAPILMLTAKSSETDRVLGLEMGADDYVTKPFSPRELVARARAVLRRVQEMSAPALKTCRFGDVVFEVEAQRCVIGDRIVPLTPTEFALLQVLVGHPGQVLSRMQLLEAAHLGVYDGVERTIDVHIHNLRHKLESDPAHPRHILTVFGAGYRFSDGEA